MTTLFKDLIYVGGEGEEVLTELGQFMKDFVIMAMQEFAVILMQVRDLVLEWNGESEAAYGMLSLLTIPLQTLLYIMEQLGPNLLNTIIMYKVMNKLMPIQLANAIRQMKIEMQNIGLMEKEIAIKEAKRAVDMAEFHLDEAKRYNAEGALVIQQSKINLDTAETAHVKAKTAAKMTEYGAMLKIIAAQIAINAGMFLIIYWSGKYADDAPRKAAAFSALAGAVMGMAIAWQLLKSATKGNLFVAAIAGLVLGYGFHKMMRKMMQVPDMSELEGYTMPSMGTPSMTSAETQQSGYLAMDTGGFIYADTGLATSTQHRMVAVEPGEQILSRTATAEGGGSGIVVNVGDVYAQDGTDFAEKVAEALPYALRNINDVGGL